MIDFVTANWGGLASAAGVIVSLVGLGWAIKEARGARSASQAAQTAAGETKTQIERYLQTVDSERAIWLIQRIKLLHDVERWEAAMEQYQALRLMLSNIIARLPGGSHSLYESLAIGRVQLQEMENHVGERISQDDEEPDRLRLNQILNGMQSNLEELASAIGFGDSQEEVQ